MKPAWFTDLPSPPDHAPVRLGELAWPEIQALPPADQVVLLPVGAIEQHGPHLPIDTDLRIAENVCLLASALTGAPVLPPLVYGVSVGHTEKWPGTFSLRHQTFIDSVCDLAAWLAATGWRRVILVNGHCGNDACLRVAVDRIRSSTPLLAAVRNTWELSPEIAAAAIFCRPWARPWRSSSSRPGPKIRPWPGRPSLPFPAPDHSTQTPNP